MTTNPTWAALRNPAFRKLWIAAVISGTCVAAHDSAANWTMNIFTGSPLLLSLLSTVASLPFFLFTLPAGALADKVDRQKLVCTISVCMAATAFALAVLGWLHLLNPCLILGCVFFIGVGFAIDAPAWTSIVPQVVSDAELPSAATLSGLQFQHLGHCRSSVGWFAGPAGRSEFCLCSKCRLLPLGRCGNSAMETTNPPGEASVGELFPIFRDDNPLCSQRTRVSDRVGSKFPVCSIHSVIPALMPVVGLKVLHLSSSDLGLLFTSMGAGSVIGAIFIIPWLRARFSPDSVTLLVNLLLVLVYVLMALVRQTEVFFVVAALAGVGWTMSPSELRVPAQRAMPGWARGRMNAMVIMISQGAMALGGVIWGSAAAMAGASYTSLGTAMLFLTSCFWPVGSRSTLQETSKRELKTIQLEFSNLKR
jgi:MFS family permease